MNVPPARNDDTPVLLDVNLLVALSWPEHVLHGVAQTWFAGWTGGWATSPITESGFVRLSMNPTVAPTPVSRAGALDMVAAIQRAQGHRWWTDEVDLCASDLARRAPVAGYRQVTDVHLVALAAHYGGRLATLDRAVLDALLVDHRHLVLLVPPIAG